MDSSRKESRAGPFVFTAGLLLVVAAVAWIVILARTTAYENPVVATWRTPAVAMLFAFGLALVTAGLSWDRRLGYPRWLHIPVMAVIFDAVALAVIGLVDDSTFDALALRLRGAIASAAVAAPWLAYRAWKDPEAFFNVAFRFGITLAAVAFMGGAIAVALNRWLPASGFEVREYTILDKTESRARSTKWLVTMQDARGRTLDHTFVCASCVNSLHVRGKATFSVRRGPFGYEYFVGYAPVK